MTLILVSNQIKLGATPSNINLFLIWKNFPRQFGRLNFIVGKTARKRLCYLGINSSKSLVRFGVIHADFF